MEHTFDHDYWDRIWDGEKGSAMGSAGPNPHLVREVENLPPGTALDAGCGAGAEAIWLATRGWQVTGADVAAAALERAAQRGDEAGVAERLTWVRADLSTWEPGPRYDLVTTHYAHPAMPQLDFYERVASWVAPGGTMFIVGHLHHHHEAEERHENHDEGPPDSATATAAAISERLHPDQWDVVTAEETHRTMTGPGGAETTIHDVIVRAVRRP